MCLIYKKSKNVYNNNTGKTEKGSGAMMSEKNRTREVAFIETSDEKVKGMIEKAFLNNGISYLVRISPGKFYIMNFRAPKRKYSFYINRLQLELAEEVITDKALEEDKVVYLV